VNTELSLVEVELETREKYNLMMTIACSIIIVWKKWLVDCKAYDLARYGNRIEMDRFGNQCKSSLLSGNKDHMDSVFSLHAVMG
jgi:hypothetical protein